MRLFIRTIVIRRDIRHNPHPLWSCYNLLIESIIPGPFPDPIGSPPPTESLDQSSLAIEVLLLLSWMLGYSFYLFSSPHLSFARIFQSLFCSQPPQCPFSIYISRSLVSVAYLYFSHGCHEFSVDGHLLFGIDASKYRSPQFTTSLPASAHGGDYYLRGARPATDFRGGFFFLEQRDVCHVDIDLHLPHNLCTVC